MNPKVNCRLRVMPKSQCWVVSCNPCTALLGNAEDGEGYASVGQKVYGTLLHVFLNFSFNLKLLQKVFLKNHGTEIMIKKDSLLLV